MNPFVNPNKRDVSLPDGCKDLIDILQSSHTQPLEKIESTVGIVEWPLPFPQPPFNHEKKIRMFIGFVLYQAQQNHATELIIGTAQPEGKSIKYKAGDTWHDLVPFPSNILRDIISELARMAKFPAGQITGKGVLDLTTSQMRLKWNVVIASDECKLTRMED